MKIMLCCAAGMSTSLLVTKMNPVSEAKDHLDADIILLGPQIRYAEKSVKELVDGKMPVQNIDMRSYGRMDGEKVLSDALKAIEDFKK